MSRASPSTGIHSPAGSFTRIWLMTPSPFRSSGPSSSAWSSRSSLSDEPLRASATSGFAKNRRAASGLSDGTMNQVSDFAASGLESRRLASASAASLASGTVPSSLATTSTAGTVRVFAATSGPISRATTSSPAGLFAIVCTAAWPGWALA